MRPVTMLSLNTEPYTRSNMIYIDFVFTLTEKSPFSCDIFWLLDQALLYLQVP